MDKMEKRLEFITSIFITYQNIFRYDINDQMTKKISKYILL